VARCLAQMVMPCVIMVLLCVWSKQRERFVRGLLFLFMFILGFSISEYMEALYTQVLREQSRRLSTSEASAAADSQLNHVLKNRLIGAAFMLSQVRAALAGVHAAEQSRGELRTVIEQMRVTVDWIHRRELFLQLASGSYKSTQARVEVRTELYRTLSGHHKVKAKVQTPRTLELDVDMLALMLEEGASNVSTAASKPCVGEGVRCWKAP
jgi:hypothetical protein